MSALVGLTEDGLLCRAGGFYVDPWRPVERAVITHAHSDHARADSEHYLAATPGLGVLRVGAAADIQGLAYGERLKIGDVTVSLHPAGHILGSAQHKSGVAVRFPRMLRWRGDKRAAEADAIERPLALLPGGSEGTSEVVGG